MTHHNSCALIDLIDAELACIDTLPNFDLVDEDGYPLDEISIETARLDWRYAGRTNLAKTLPALAFEGPLGF
ncbi:MAG TPA: hypothetical protein V6C72_16965 [Chroococcales cyanobacterium]